MRFRKLFVVATVATLAGLVPVHHALAAPITTEDLNTGPTGAGLAQTLVGPGVSVSSANTSGQFHAIGSFSGGAGIIGPDFDSGVVLSTGRVDSVPGPNTSDSTTTVNNSGTDPDLQALSAQSIHDAAVLEFDFTADADQVFFQYVFSSEEYNEFVNTQYNDVFGFFVNGQNCATVGEGQPVSINTINDGNPGGDTTATNPHLYRNNDLQDGGGSIDIEMDGLTTVLTCTAPVSPTEPNHLKLAIADASDAQYDSNVFIKAGSLSTEDPEPELGTDLAIAKADTPDPVTTGGIVQYTITVQNQGDLDSSVQVLDTPSSGEVVGAQGSGWSCVINAGGIESSSSASCTLDAPLAAGSTATPLKVYVQAPDTGGTITNTATVTGDSGDDPDPGDNTAVETTTVNPTTNEAGEQQVTTYCPATGCTFSTGGAPTGSDNTTNLVEVPPGGDGSLTTLHEGATTFPCGGNTGQGNSALGQETNFQPPTGYANPANPIKVTTTWDVSVWPIHKGSSDPGTSNGARGEGHVKVCMKAPVDDGQGGKTMVEFRVPRCEVVGVLNPGPSCWDQVSRNADGDISVRFLMLSPDPQWRR